MHVLVLDGLRLGRVEEIDAFLRAINRVYENLYTFDLIVDEATRRHAEAQEAQRRFGAPSRRRRVRIRTIWRPGAVVLPQDKLRLHRVWFESPGFWEFVGALNPLEVLRQYLKDRHERERDHDYRNAAEAERLRLENERLKTEIVRKRLRLLREIGVPERQIRRVVTRHVLAPLSRLDSIQDSGLIAGAKVEDRPDPERQTT